MATSRTSLADVALDPGQVGAPADQLAVGRGPVRAAPAEQGDGLEQARLAGRVGPDDEVGAGLERRLERRVAAQVERR